MISIIISSKQKFAKRLGEEAAEKIYKVKPELEKLAKDVNISITPNFFWLESNWTKGLDPENIRSFAVKVRKIPKNLGDRFKNFWKPFTISSFKLIKAQNARFRRFIRHLYYKFSIGASLCIYE